MCYKVYSVIKKCSYSTRCGKYVIQFEPLRVFEYKNI
uniref:Uncharacterized protein n=1 Tax=Staphylococcus phage HS12 TaxID=3056402 RepID=A0AA50AD69_9VIRU|nr:MAG: hypothetical protein [Staphylococcus phage HS12]